MGVQAVWDFPDVLRSISGVAVLHVRRRFRSWQNTGFGHTDDGEEWQTSMTKGARKRPQRRGSQAWHFESDPEKLALALSKHSPARVE
jgi:hypothetical protein